MKAPYTFPHRSRKAMIAYLLDRRTYADHYTPFVFEWNVKANSVDWSHPKGGEQLDPALDAAWDSYMTENQQYYGPEYRAFEAARQEVADGDWSSYPGDDQGDWEFYFVGRQGGHIVLETWRGWKIGGKDREEVRDWLEELETPTLRAFYCGIRTADSDFTPAKASENVEYFLNGLRAEWESQLEAEREAAAEEFAASMMAARPDMYPPNSCGAA